MNLENAVWYHYKCFPPEKLKYDSIMDSLLSATDALARYDQMLKNMHNSEILLAPMRNQEAVVSSRMEWTISNLDEILQYEADIEDYEEELKTKRSEIYETVLYQRTLNKAQKAIEDWRPLSESLIKWLHQNLLSFWRGAEKSPWQYKTEQNYLGEKNKQIISFIPVSPEKLDEWMEILFKYINNSNDPILIKCALMHIEFEALHPFKDWNWRIWRMMITLLLWKTWAISSPHFYISSFFEEFKDKYIDYMRDVSKDWNWEDWCIFFFEAVRSQALSNLQIAEDIKNLYDELKIVFSDLLASKYSTTALDFLFTSPVFRNNKFTKKSWIPQQTAARFTRLLAENNLINVIEESSGRRPTLYSFEPLLKLVRV